MLQLEIRFFRLSSYPWQIYRSWPTKLQRTTAAFEGDSRRTPDQQKDEISITNASSNWKQSIIPLTKIWWNWSRIVWLYRYFGEVKHDNCLKAFNANVNIRKVLLMNIHIIKYRQYLWQQIGKSPKGFTLIAILVVITIVGILAATRHNTVGGIPALGYAQQNNDLPGSMTQAFTSRLGG